MTDVDGPLRWILWDEFTEDREDRAVGSCVEVEGLFVDIPEPRVERFTLRGCVPGEALRDAVAGIGTERARLGTILVEADDDPRTDYVDNLHEVEVVAADGDDVVLAGRIEEIRAYRPATEPPAGPGFRLSVDERPLGTARTVEGLYRERPELETPDVTLIGFRPEPWFRGELFIHRQPAMRVTIMARRADGGTVSTLSPGFRADVLAVRESAAGPGLIDVELDNGPYEPIPIAARPLWDRWLAAPPVETGLWTALDPSLRHEWLRLALVHARFRSGDQPAGRTYHLDGRHVTDLNAFYCAVGEAINGPGGYFGWVPAAFEDCLGGYWGAEPPFRLVWSHSGVARRELGDDLFHDLAATMAKYRVEVVTE